MFETLKKLLIKFYSKTYKYVFLIFISSFTGNLFSQNANNNWYFGNRAAINFNNGTPTPLTLSQMVSVEGCASVSDPITGNLLFYTNGLQIWNANHNLMPNGSGLLSGENTSATQGVVITPYPGNPNLYFVFTVDETNNNGLNGFRYSVVDITLDNGLGDILPQQKNILIQTNTTERIAVTSNANGTGYWVTIHERNNNCFKSFEVTANGINTTPSISNIGSIHATLPQSNDDGTIGYMKTSNDGNKLAVVIFNENKIEIFDFDKCTGQLSNTRSVSTLDSPYGVEFSPDNTKLYFTIYFEAGFQGAVYQLNVLNNNSTPVLVGISSSFNIQSMGALQLAPDNKIYISINSEPWLSVINAPNNNGVACGFIDQAITLPNIGFSPTTGIFGLPPKVISIENNETTLPNIVFNDSCFLDTAVFQITTSQNITGVSWNFGDPNSGANNTSTQLNPTHIFSQPGQFIVSANVSAACGSFVLTDTLNIINCNTECTGQIAAIDSCLQNGTLFQVFSNSTINSISWNFGDPNSGTNNTSTLINPTHIFSQPGQFIVSANVSAACGSFVLTDTLNIINCNTECTGQIAAIDSCLQNGTLFQVFSNSTLNSIAWNFGDPNSGANNTSTQLNPTHIFSQPGQFIVSANVSAACGSFVLSDTISVINCSFDCIAQIFANDSCLNNNTFFSIVANDTVNSVSWNFGDPNSGMSNTSQLLNPTHVFSAAGVFAVRANVNMNCGVFLAELSVTVLNCDSASNEFNEIFVPQVFSPNADNINDILYVRGSVDTFTLNIFNRWGNLVFTTSDKNTGWDGRYNNQELDAGVFVYSLTGVDTKGQSINKKGNITLVK